MYIGHTRFSLFQPGSNNWRASEKDRFQNAEDYRNYLYSPERLDLRVDIFLRMSLPQLSIAARDRTVHHIISYSASLPSKYKTLLTEVASSAPFIVLDECSDEDTPLSPQDLARSLTPLGESCIFAEYRLDDDDVLPSNYYEQIEPYVSFPFVGMYVSLGQGLTAVYRDGHFYDVRRCHSAMLAIGLAKICKVDETGLIHAPPVARHTVSDTVAPVIVDSRSLGFIWARHPDQDTAVGVANSHTRAELLERAHRQISHHPIETDWELVSKHFPTISDQIHRHLEPGLRQTPLITSRAQLPRNGLKIPTPELQGRCEFEVSIRAGTSKPGRDVILSFQFQDERGNPIIASQYEEKLNESGVVLSSRKNLGFCRFIAARPGLRKETFVINLPDKVSIGGLSLHPRPGVAGRLDVEQFTVIDDGEVIANNNKSMKHLDDQAAEHL